MGGLRINNEGVQLGVMEAATPIETRKVRCKLAPIMNCEVLAVSHASNQDH